MTERMDQFTALGFRKVGTWKMAGLNLTFDLAERDQRGNFIYAFVMGKAIKFLEYSRLPLEARMDAYKHTDHRYAGTFQPMNKRLREKILAALEEGEAVEIWAFYPGRWNMRDSAWIWPRGWQKDWSRNSSRGGAVKFNW